MEQAHCPLCGANQAKLLFERKDHLYRTTDDDFGVVRCRTCRCVYVSPRPTEDEIHEFYPQQFYRGQYNPQELLQVQDETLRLKYEYCKDIPAGRLLDIGCATGEFLYYMQQRGWEVFGSDFSDKPPNVFGLDIHYGSLSEAGYAPASFDLITLWAVLEHVYDPLTTMKQVYGLLKPGGQAIILVTNFNSLPGRFMQHDDVPRHTTLFTHHTLKKMFECAGFLPQMSVTDGCLFGGSNRGALNYLVKVLAGEKLTEVVAQNRTPGRWNEFSSQLRGKPSRLMRYIDRVDIAQTPYLDKILDRLGLGFILVGRATKPKRIS